MNCRDLLNGLVCAALLTTVAMLNVPATAQSAPPNTLKQQALDKALVKAIRSHNASLVRKLLEKGADSNARDLDAAPDRHGTVQPPPKNKPTALLIVFDDAQIPTGKRENGAPQYKLRPDPVEIVKALLEKNANPNVTDYDETFPLLEAVKYKYIASVRLLLQHQANPNTTWVHGITPLHNAVSNKDIPTVKALLTAGASREARSAFDNPAHPLSEEIADLLKESGDSRQDNPTP